AEISIYENALSVDRSRNAVREALSVSERSLASIVGALGDLALAATQMQRAVDIAEELLKIDPENARWTEIGADAQLALAERLFLDAQHGRAATAGARARQRALSLAVRDESGVGWHLLLARSVLFDAVQLGDAGDHLGALRLAQGVLQRVQSSP